MAFIIRLWVKSDLFSDMTYVHLATIAPSPGNTAKIRVLYRKYCLQIVLYLSDLISRNHGNPLQMGLNGNFNIFQKYILLFS